MAENVNVCQYERCAIIVLHLHKLKSQRSAEHKGQADITRQHNV